MRLCLSPFCKCNKSKLHQLALIQLQNNEDKSVMGVQFHNKDKINIPQVDRCMTRHITLETVEVGCEHTNCKLMF